MKTPRRFWTPADDAELARAYPTQTAAELAARLGRTLGAVYQRVEKLGLAKPRSSIAATSRAISKRPDHGGKDTRFKPGNVGWNTGMKGWDAGGRSHETRFKKGQRSRAWLPVGSERMADGYLQRKITETGYTPRDWRGVHILAWESAHGPVPAGHAVTFRDGNRMNFELANLELVSRRELMRRNSYHTRYPKEIGRAIQLRGALVRAINKRTQGADA